MTSHDAVSFVRRLTGIKKVGHSGTLDPMAEGVLPIFIGKAARLIEYLGINNGSDAKEYVCTLRFGLETDTFDIWGKTLATYDVPKELDHSKVTEVLKSFEGESEQLPPMYSAIKVNGRKLYEYARKNQTLPEGAVKLRKINIKKITVNEIRDTDAEVCFTVECSKGTYIRSLCYDAGRLLGYGAVMSALTRTKSDGFLIEDSKTPEELENEPIKLLPPEFAVRELPLIELDQSAGAQFTNGIKLPLHETYANLQGQYARVCQADHFLGVAKIENGVLCPHKVIRIEEQ